MWNIEKRCRITYLQSRNRHTDIENKYMDRKGGKESGINWENEVDIYIYTIMYKIDDKWEYTV